MSENEKPVVNTTGRTSPDSVSRPEEKKHIKIGRHGAGMIMTSDPEKNEEMLRRVGYPVGYPEPKSLEERVRIVKKLIAQSMGVPDINSIERDVPDRIGFRLQNQAEQDVLFGVLRLMTETDYRGTFQVPTSQVLQAPLKPTLENQTKGYDIKLTKAHLGGAYQNIPSTPVLRINQTDLMGAIGYNPESGSDRERVSKAVASLASRMNFLLWTRFERDDKGKVVKDRNGRTKFELVSEFSPVLNVRFVSGFRTDDKGVQVPVLKYYEISLPPVLLDQVTREYGGINGGYFLLLPVDANTEIETAYRDLFHRGRMSPTIRSFCFWLRLKVQDRQNRERNPFSRGGVETELRVSYESLCQQLNISETTQDKRVRTTAVLDEGIQVAKKIGYILEGYNDLLTDEYVFKLNLEFYPDRYKKDSES